MIIPLSYDRRGAGEPLILLHGIGHRWQVWGPVLDELADHHDVIAVDFPGFGASAPLAAGDTPTPQRLADRVAELAAELGLDRPHVAGISLGGFVALQLAATGRARSVTGISPAGVWGPPGPSRYTQTVLRSIRRVAVTTAPRAELLTRPAVMRRLLGGLNFAHAERIPAAVLAADLRNLATCPGWDATLAALESAWLSDATGLADVPAQIAWGTRDLILPRGRSLQAGLLPASVPVHPLPGCGHSPTYDDPARVVSTLLTGTGVRP